jgi:predicted nucleic acid-binding protein
MITADSSVWIGYFNGQISPQVEALDAALDDSAQEVVLLDVVLMEVLRGFRHDKEHDLARAALAPLELAVAGGEDVAFEAAALYRRLRCIRNDCVLIHADRDFNSMQSLEGLQSWQLQ